jgi:hypothetical protein
MMKRLTICATSIAFVATYTVAFADPATAIRSDISAPVQITACTSKTGHVQGNWGTESDSVHLAVSFTNKSTKDIAAVLVGFELENQFGDVLGRATTQATGDFSPGVSIDDQHWDGQNEWPGFSVLVCSAQRVLFKDGEVWRAGDPAAPQASVSRPPAP